MRCRRQGSGTAWVPAMSLAKGAPPSSQQSGSQVIILLPSDRGEQGDLVKWRSYWKSLTHS